MPHTHTDQPRSGRSLPAQRLIYWGGLSLLLALVAILALGPIRFALASGTPDITLTKSAPAQVLIGGEAEYAMTASSPAGAPKGYNLSFREVLPSGVSYVAGSSAQAPRILANRPAAGQTTLIWENLADLSGNSSFTLTYRLAHSVPAYPVGTSFTTQGGAYLNSDPRQVPDFDVNGLPIGPSPSSHTGFATADGTTTTSAIQIKATEPSSEGELLRGVHAHKTVYSLRVQNNSVDPTTAIVVDEYLPAGLEFLGCALADNTTDAPTNAGSPREYPGAPALTTPPIPAAPDCLAPGLVETVSVDPDGAGPRPLGVYTHLRWSVGPLPAGANRVIQYISGIPIRENTLDWNGALAGNGTPPASQTSNLDNNSGAETRDEQALVTYSVASGLYQGSLAVSDDDSLTRSAEDLAIAKSVSSSSLDQGDITTWTLRLRSSEYRFVDNIVVTDTLPDGLCPLSSTNLEGTPECAPTGDLPSSPYTSALENPDGTWTLVWDQTTAPALTRLQPSSSAVITFPTRTRTFYQENGVDDAPVLSRDSWQNTVSTQGIDTAICAPGQPDCGDPGLRISHDEADGVADTDVSSAGQSAVGPTLTKLVAVPGAAPVICATATYSADIARSYGPGDRVCWRVRVDFPSNLDTSTVTVDDFLPPNTAYEAGSATATSANTVPSTFDSSGVASGVLSWDLGSVDSGSAVFEVVFSSIVGSPSSGTAFDLRQNLAKLGHANTDGTTFPLRASADFEWAEPQLSVLTGIRDVNNLPGAGNGPNVDGVTVQGGDVITVRVDVDNSGNKDAVNTTVWSALPAGTTCAEVSAISSGGTCAAGRIAWSGLGVPGKALVSDPSPRLTLTYDIALPADLSPSTSLSWRAGVRTYDAALNTGAGATTTYTPAANIDPALTTTNAAAAADSTNILTTAATLTVGRTTEINEVGNPAASATIGEEITYTPRFTVPQGTTLHGTPRVSAPLGTRQTLVPGTVTATLNGGPLPAGVTVNYDSGTATVSLDFAGPYTNAPGSGADVFEISFRAQVDDETANSRTGALVNYNLPQPATASWLTYTGSAASATGTVTTTIVEPNLAITKDENDVDNVVSSGQIVRYTLEVTNPPAPGRVSSAHNVTTVDQLPQGLDPVDALGNPVPDLGSVQPSGGIWDASARTITWQTTAIPLSGIQILRYDVRVSSAGVGSSSLANAVQTRGTSLPNSLDAAGERTSLSAGPPVGYSASATDVVTRTQPTISKLGPASATIGEDFTYTLRVTIPSGIALPDATVIDQLPDGIDLLAQDPAAVCVSGCPLDFSPTTPSAVSNPDGSSRLAWFLGDVSAAPVDRVLELTFTAKVDDRFEPEGTPVTDASSLVNTARVHWNQTDSIGAPPTNAPLGSGFSNGSATASHALPVNEPALALDKSVSGGPATRSTQPGDTMTFTVVVSNGGTSPAHDVVVVDQPDAELEDIVLISGAAFATDGWSAADPDIRWQIPGPIAPGGSQTLTYTARIIGSGGLSDAQQVVNVADVPLYWGVPEATRTANPGSDYRSYDNVPSDSVTLNVSLPSLSVAKTTGASGYPESAFAEVGQDFTWRIVVRNTDDHASFGSIQIEDTLPAGWTYVPGSAVLAPGGQIEPSGSSTLTWDVGSTIGPGQTVTIDFRARAPVGATSGPFVNTATATGTDLSGAGASAGGPYSAGPDGATANLRLPVIGLSKTPDGDTVPAGAPGQWQVTVSNSGQVTARDVVVEDVIPAGVSYTAGTASGPSLVELSNVAGPGTGERTVRWQIADLPAGSSSVITIPVVLERPQPNGTVITNQASVSVSELTGTVADSGSLTVGSAPVFLPDSTKSAAPASGTIVSPGDQINYSLHAENDGNEDASGVVVTDEIPADTTYRLGSVVAPGGTSVEWLVAGSYVSTEPSDASSVEGLRFTVGALPVDDSWDGSFTVSVAPALPDATMITNQAFLSSTQTPGGVSIGSTVHEVDSATQITVAKTASDDRVVLNDGEREVAYRLRAVNAGNEIATSFAVVDGPPAGTTIASIDAGLATAVSCSTDPSPPHTFGACPTDLETVSRVRWSFSTLLTTGAQDVGFTISVRRPFANGSVLENTATFSSDQGGAGSSNTVRTEVASAPRLELTKSVSSGETQPGATLDYEMRFINSGSEPAANVALSDVIPAMTTYVAGSADAGAQFLVDGAYEATEPADPSRVAGLRWNVDPLVIDNQMTRRFQVRLAPVIDPATVITNNANVRADGLTPVSDSASSVVRSAATLQIEKSVAGPPSRPRVGSMVSYMITVRGGGNARSRDVVITDNLPRGLAFVSASDGGASSGQTVTWRLAQLVPGESRSVSITTRVTAQGVGAESLVNSAGVTASGGGASVPAGASAPILAPLPTQAVLRVRKSGPAKVTAGRRVAWKIVVQNVGKSPSAQTVMIDRLPRGFSLPRSSHRYRLRAGTVQWNVGPIRPGRSKVIRITLRADGDATGRRTNVAIARASNADSVAASADSRIRGAKKVRAAPAVTG